MISSSGSPRDVLVGWRTLGEGGGLGLVVEGLGLVRGGLVGIWGWLWGKWWGVGVFLGTSVGPYLEFEISVDPRPERSRSTLSAQSRTILLIVRSFRS